MNPNLSSEAVVLRGGLTIPAEAIRLGIELENSGWTLLRQGQKLVVRPSEPNRTQPNSEQQARIRRWKDHLLLVLDYTAPTITWVGESERESEQAKTNKSEQSEQDLF